MKNYKVAIASDHAGYETKEKIIEFLKTEKHEVKDFGCNSADTVDYPDFAHPLALALENKEFDFGIVLCGSGNGVNMTVNKYQTIRSALCWNVEVAKLARQHNDANICAIPARFVSFHDAVNIVFAFLFTKFDGGRHMRRINKIPVS
jgi:ribose 5-phosphate isomerase B